MASFSPYPPIQYLSRWHPHSLELTNAQTHNTIRVQAAGSLQPLDGCTRCGHCNSTLHLSCAQSPQEIYHPYLAPQALRFLPRPMDSRGRVWCNECYLPVEGFSYTCTRWNIDLHPPCACKRLSLAHQSHPSANYVPYGNHYQPGGFHHHFGGGGGGPVQNNQATTLLSNNVVIAALQGLVGGLFNAFGQQTERDIMNAGNSGSGFDPGTYGDIDFGSWIFNGFGDFMGTQ